MTSHAWHKKSSSLVDWEVGGSATCGIAYGHFLRFLRAMLRVVEGHACGCRPSGFGWVVPAKWLTKGQGRNEALAALAQPAESWGQELIGTDGDSGTAQRFPRGHETACACPLVPRCSRRSRQALSGGSHLHSHCRGHRLGAFDRQGRDCVHAVLGSVSPAQIVGYFPDSRLGPVRGEMDHSSLARVTEAK